MFGRVAKLTYLERSKQFTLTSVVSLVLLKLIKLDKSYLGKDFYRIVRFFSKRRISKMFIFMRRCNLFSSKKKKKKKIHGLVKRQLLCQSLINASISRAPLIKRYFMKSHTLAKKHKFKQKNETFLMIKETSISKHLQIHSFLCFTTHSRCHAAFFYSVSNKQQAVDVTLSSEADVGRGKTQACIDLVCVESRAKTEKL